MAKPPALLATPAAGAPALPSGHRPLAEALRGHETLSDLFARQRESSQRLLALRQALGHPLLEAVAAGPLDDKQWRLLAPDNAVAAKLRHLLPQLDDALQAGGWPPRELKVAVLKHR